MASEPILKLSAIDKSYAPGRIQSSAKKILEGVSLTVFPGEILAVLGPSGSGKSTLLDIISGLQPPDNGAVSLNGKLTYNTQRDLLLPWRTLLENILLPAELNLQAIEKELPSLLAKASSLLELLDLSLEGEKFPKELSGGMKQRGALARSLLLQSKLLLLDEPLSAVDLDTRYRIAERLRKLLKDRTQATLLVTHSIDEALIIADRVVVLKGTPATVGLELNIDLLDSVRSALGIRNSEKASRYFETLWEALNRKEPHGTIKPNEQTKGERR